MEEDLARGRGEEWRGLGERKERGRGKEWKNAGIPALVGVPAVPGGPAVANVRCCCTQKISVAHLWLRPLECICIIHAAEYAHNLLVPVREIHSMRTMQ